MKPNTTHFTKISLFILVLFIIFSVSNAVYSQNSDAYQLQATLNSGLAANSLDNFGISVAIDGNTAIVGTQNQNVGANVVQGAAYIYVRNGSTWSLQQMLTASDGREQDKFGVEVALEGDTAFVARYNPSVVGRGDGKIYVFKRTGTTWNETQTIVSNDIATGDAFGSAMAVDNGTLVAGAFNKAVSGSPLGATYIFTDNGGTWTQQAKFTDANSAFNDKFGFSVDISGDSVIIGTPGQLGLGADSGRGFTYIFTRSGTSWTQQQKLIASDRAAGDVFGFDVAIFGDTTAISAKDDDSFRGAVYIFTRSGGIWTERTKIVQPNTSSLSAFGTAIDLEGQNLAIGVARFDTLPTSTRGVVVYSGSGAAWTQTDVLETSGASSVDFDNLSIISGQASFGTSTNGAIYIHATSLTPRQSANFNFDFDGDGKADLGIFRPSEGNWYLNRSTAGFSAVNFGLAADQLTPADFDGDGKTDIAVWREAAQSRFYIFQSSNNVVRQEVFGIPGDDPKVVSDWDGDGKADPAVYRAGTQGTFYFRGSNNNPSGNITFLNWGTTGDKPMRGDFDGDGKLDRAVFRPSNGVWYILNSGDNSVRFTNWGSANDKFASADFDGDRKTDLTVFRSGIWYILQSSNGQPRFVSFGLATDQLTPADFDGDGKSDVAVYRNGIWYVLNSASGNVSVSSFGLTGDKAVESAFVQ